MSDTNIDVEYWNGAKEGSLSLERSVSHSQSIFMHGYPQNPYVLKFLSPTHSFVG